MATPAVESSQRYLTVETNYFTPQDDGTVRVTTISSRHNLLREEDKQNSVDKTSRAASSSLNQRIFHEKQNRPVNAIDKALAECLHVKDSYIAGFRPDDNKIYLTAKKELVITSEGMDQLVQILIQGKDKIEKVDLRCCGDNVEHPYKLGEALMNTAVKVVQLQCKMFGKDANAFGKAILDLSNQNRSLELTLKTRGMYHAIGQYLAVEGNKTLKTNVFKLAIVYFSKALEINSKDPNNKETFFMRGVSYSAIGLNAKAIKNYKEALKIDPNFEEAKNELHELERLGKTTDQKK